MVPHPMGLVHQLAQLTLTGEDAFAHAAAAEQPSLPCRAVIVRGGRELGEDGEKGPHPAPSLPLKHRLPLRPPQHPGIRATAEGSKKAGPGAASAATTEAAPGLRRAGSRAASGQVVGGGKGSFPYSQAALESTGGAGRSYSGAEGQGPRAPSRPAGPRHPPSGSLPEHPGDSEMNPPIIHANHPLLPTSSSCFNCFYCCYCCCFYEYSMKDAFAFLKRSYSLMV